MNIVSDYVFYHSLSKEESDKKTKEVINQLNREFCLTDGQKFVQTSQNYSNGLQKQNPQAIIEYLYKSNAQGLQNLMNELQGALKRKKAPLKAFFKIGLLYITLIHLKSISLLQALFKKNITYIQPEDSQETYDSIQERQKSIQLIKMAYQIFINQKQLLTKIIDFISKENKQLLFQALQFYNFICNNEDSKYLYGKALIEYGRIEEGIKILSQIEESPSIRSLESVLIIASNFEKLQMFGDSIKYYQKIIDQDKGETQFSTISAFQIGTILKNLNFLPQCLHYYQKSISYNKLRTLRQRQIQYKSMMEIGQLLKSQSYPVPIQFIQVVSNLQQITSRSKIQAFLCFAGSNIGHNHRNLIGNKLNRILQNEELPLELKLMAGKVYLLIGNLIKAKQLLQNASQPYQNYLNMSFINLKQGRIISGRTNFQGALRISQYETVQHEYFLLLLNEYYKKEDSKYQITYKLSDDINKICDEYYQKGLEYKKHKKYFQSLGQFKKIKLLDQNRSDYIIHVIDIFIFCQRYADALNFLEIMAKNAQKEINVLDKIHGIYISTKDINLKKHIISKYPFIPERKFSSSLPNNERKQFKLSNFDIQLGKLNFNSFKANPLWQFIRIKLTLKPTNLKQTEKLLQKSQRQFYFDGQNLKALAKICIQKGINKYAERFLSRALKMKPFDEEIIDLYIIYLENKKDFSQKDLKSFRKNTSNIKVKNKIKIKIAQMYCSLTLNIEAMKILIQTISNSPTFQSISVIQMTLKTLKYSEQDCLLTMLQYNNNIDMIHERLAFIYRLKRDYNREIYHQQQIIRLRWDKQKALDRLVQLYQVANRDGDYIESMKELSLIQSKNRQLRLRLADELRKRMRYHQQIAVLMRELKNRPLDATIYQLIFAACKHLNGDGFLPTNIFHIDERPFYYMQISFYYLHINQLSESMQFFILAIQNIFFHQISQQSQKSIKILKQSLAHFQTQMGSQYDIDIAIKQAMFAKYSENEEQYQYYIFKIEKKQDHELPNLQKRKKIIQELSAYSYWQKLYIVNHVINHQGKS